MNEPSSSPSPPPPSSPPPSSSPPQGLPVYVAGFVFVAAGVAAGFLGALAGGAYADSSSGARAGMAWGAVTGLIVAAPWCWLMHRALLRGATRQSLVSRGVWLGIAAGVLSTILLHAGLILAMRELAMREEVGVLLIAGLVFGVLAGAFVGALGGALSRPSAEPRQDGP